MRKVTGVIALAVLLWSVAVPVGAQEAGPTLTTPYPSLTVEPGDTASFTLSLSAPSSEELALDTGSLPSGWTATFRGAGFVVASITASPDASPELRLDVITPVDSTDGSYPITVTAAGDSGTVSLPLTVIVQSGAGGTVLLTPDFPALRGPADASFPFDVTVRNDTPNQVTLELTAEGPIGWSVDARPSGASQASSVTVESGASERIRVTANPPIDVQAGVYDFLVKVRGGGVDAEAALAIQIEGSFSLAISTADQRLNADVTAGQPTQLPIIIFNTGTAALEGITITPTPPRNWEVTFDPEAVASLAAGETATVIATITPSGDAIAGDYRMTISASVDQAEDSMEIRATVSPSAIWGLLGVGLIALTLGALAWVFRRFGRR
jgi:uncharacterized membrane protein